MEKLTAAPASLGRNDLATLQSAGLSDEDVLHVVEVTGYYAYVNRLANGLGVELEP